MKHFKSTFFRVMLAAVLVIGLVAASPWYWTLVVRTQLIVYGVITGQNTGLNANLITLTNKDAAARFSVDSAGTLTAVAYAVTPGTNIFADSGTFKAAIVGYHHNTSLKSFSIVNYAGTAVLSFDSLGGIHGGTGYFADTAAFTTTATRVSISIPGALATDRYIVLTRTQSETLPVAGDLLSYRPVKDSLVVLRVVGTVSGGKFSWVRLPY